MPLQGHFTTTGIVLFERAPSIDGLARALGFGWEPLDAMDDVWIGGAGLTALLPSGARAIVDVVDRPWPDDMGHPETDPELFGAWATGHLGGATYPRALFRAIGMGALWPEAEEALAGAGAFVRIRASYAAARGMDTAILPPDADPLRDAIDVLRIAQRALAAPGALGWFCPGGEVVAPRAAIDVLLERVAKGGPPPLEAYVGVRSYPLPGTDLVVMDTVGCEQLFRTDLEVLARIDDLDPDATQPLLLGLTAQRLRANDMIGAETVGLPGGPEYHHEEIDESIGAPPRRVIRLTRADRPPIAPIRH